MDYRIVSMDGKAFTIHDVRSIVVNDNSSTVYGGAGVIFAIVPITSLIVKVDGEQKLTA